MGQIRGWAESADDVEDNAPWKKRYRTQVIVNSQIASLAPTKRILASNRSGAVQWYAWDIPSNKLQQITDTHGGHSSYRILSSDGQWVYYFDDTQGNEIGHFVRMPVDGGELQDIIPDLPPYSSFGFSISRSGNCIGFLAAYENQSPTGVCLMKTRQKRYGDIMSHYLAAPPKKSQNNIGSVCLLRMLRTLIVFVEFRNYH